jgi:biopolymer transport protein ExbD
LSSSGIVTWNTQDVPVESMPHELRRTMEAFRSQGMRPVAEIEAHDNASPHDVQRLTEIAEEAGFESVRVRRLNWPDVPQNK